MLGASLKSESHISLLYTTACGNENECLTIDGMHTQREEGHTKQTKPKRYSPGLQGSMSNWKESSPKKLHYSAFVLSSSLCAMCFIAVHKKEEFC